MVVAWFIWYRRNKNRLKEPCIPPGKIFEAAQTLLLEFQATPSRQPPSAPPTGVKWKAPSPDFYKVNYDGTMFGESSEVGIGVVVRNENGEVMASLAEQITIPASVQVLEALATRRATIFSMELGLHRVIIEGDSEIVFKALSRECSNCSCIIKDCKSISGFFSNLFLLSYQAAGQLCGHALAKRARKSSPLLVWMESVPPDISYLVFVDVTPQFFL